MTCRIDEYGAFCIRHEQVNCDSERRAQEIGRIIIIRPETCRSNQD